MVRIVQAHFVSSYLAAPRDGNQLYIRPSLHFNCVFMVMCACVCVCVCVCVCRGAMCSDLCCHVEQLTVAKQLFHAS